MRLIDILEQNSENIYTVSCNKITEPLIKEFLINEVCKKSKINFINNFNFKSNYRSKELLFVFGYSFFILFVMHFYYNLFD